MKRLVTMSLGAALWVLLAAPPSVSADQDPNLSRGFAQGELYDTSGLDTVNLFNGSLTLALPLGPRYPVGDGFSYGLTLAYSSSVWDFETRTEPQGTYIQALPRRSSNAGLGWKLSLGGTLYGPFHPGSAGARWRLETQDGGEHQFFDSLHPGESSSCRYTRDGSYLRLCFAGTTATVEFGDGTVRTYQKMPFTPTVSPPWDFERYRLASIADRLGNSVAVSYNASDTLWTITDSVGRAHTVHFSLVSIDGKDYPHATEARVAKFGGGTASYALTRDKKWIRRNCKDTDGETTAFVGVPLLRSIGLPAGAGSYRMDDVDSYFERPSCAIPDHPGTLHRVRLPTDGLLEWTYQEYDYLQRPNLPTTESLAIESTAGVATKRELDAAGTCSSGPLWACTWSYSWDRELVFGTANGNRWTIVRSPLGDETKSYFREQPLPINPGSSFTGWDYGLPYTDTTKQGDLYLSQEIFDGTAASGTLLRSVYSKYERDQLQSQPPNPRLRLWHDSNRRPAANRTHFEDDLTSGLPRFIEVRSSDFDGLGHHRQQVKTTNFGGAASRTTVTSFNPSRGTYAYDPVTNSPASGHNYSPWPDSSNWVLGTYTSMWAVEPGSSPVESRYCFQAGTGRLLRERRLVAAGVLNHRDVILQHTRYRDTMTVPEEIRYQVKVYGGDTQSVTTSSSWCSGSPTSEQPMYRTRSTFIDGVLSKAERLKRGGVTLFVQGSLTIDPSSGLASSSTDATGITTSYGYDELGRLTAILPQFGGGARTTIGYTTATGGSPARATVTQLRNNGSGLALQESRYTYDPFGRLAIDEIRVPGHAGWQGVTTAYNALGWKTSVTERGSSHATGYLQHDPFGRPGEIRLPDWTAANDHSIKLDYNGIRRVGRSVSIATSLTGTETRSTTSEIYDLEGRLWRVQEPSGAGGSNVNTDYTYDSAGRLKNLRIRGPVDQWRYFNYDGRGFLLSETHPERGTTSYLEYDPMGHAGRVRTGASQGKFDLAYVFDEAERLTQVKEWRSAGNGRELKAFTYGMGTSAANRSMNKIVTAIRHNYVPHPSSGVPLDVTVTETHTYAGVGGRLSRRDTELNTEQEFTQSWAYDDLGQLIATTYPSCEHAATCNTNGNRHPRTVSRSYEQGFLTSVPGFASSIDYHPNGMLDQVTHTNTMIYGQDMDPHGMLRPGSLWISQGGHLVPFGSGLPTLVGQGVPLPYEYDGAGNVKRWADENYRYDKVSRIVETINDDVENQVYAYDPYGNLTSVTTDGSIRPLAVDITTNRLSGTQYDAAGNQTQWGFYTYQYDSFNMMWHRGGTGAHDTYAYTADDERIWAVDATSFPWKERFFLRDLDGSLLRTFYTENRASNLAWEQDYIRRDGLPLATVKAEAGETTYHFHPNHLGTPLMTSDEQGVRAGNMFLYPFGERKHPEVPSNERLRFTGHERDLNGPGETDDLDYMHARFCNPLTGRFLAADPVLGSPKSPQSWNRYAYTMNNPLKYVDPTGMAEVCAGAGISRVCVFVDGNGDGDSSDDDLTKDQIRLLSESFADFIRANDGADLGDKGTLVSGGNEADRSLIRAASQFVGANLEGGWKNTEIRLVDLGEGHLGRLDTLRNSRYPEGVYFLRINPGEGDHGSNPSSIARTLTHEYLHRESYRTSGRTRRHRALDNRAKESIKQWGLAGKGCPAAGGATWFGLGPQFYSGC